MQRYYLEALGHQGRKHPPAKWDDVENRLAYCWYASGFAGGVEWDQVRHIVKQSWRMSKAVRTERGSVARLLAVQ